MTAKTILPVADNADDREYHAYIQLIGKRLKAVTGQLFTTDAGSDDPDGLFANYLAAFPKEEMQYHNCNCCKRFINTYGGLVTINDDGTLESPLWNNEDAPELYQGSVRAMLRQVKKARVTGVFASKETVWGTPQNTSEKTGATWQHLSAVPTRQMIHVGVQEPHQKVAEKRQEFAMVCAAAAEFSIPVVQQVVNFLRSETLYRSERFIGPARWFLEVVQLRKENSGKARDNLTWKAVAAAPTGFTHVKSSAVGTIYDDVKAGLALDEVKRKFAAITSPNVYQRATVAPSAGAIDQAEKLFEKLGLAPALPRRYALLNELPYNAVTWLRSSNAVPVSKRTAKGGVFDHLQPQASAVNITAAPPSATVTWDKFQRTVLPNALNIEVLIPNDANHFMALTAAVNEDAPPLLQWDSEGARNPFAWYYASGVDAEMNKRLVAAGARTKDNDIRFSGMWDNLNDLDIHAYTPTGHHIYYGNKQPQGQHGWLDVDMNAGGKMSMTPVENIRWEKGLAPNGHYRFEMNLYGTHDGFGPRTPFRAEIEVAGQVFSFEGVVDNYTHRTVTVAEFDYVRGQPVRLSNTTSVRSTAVSPNEWNVTPGSYVPVTAIVKSPNLWGATPQVHNGQHAFFLLTGCKDKQQGVGRGFFNEHLRSELHGVRSVMEAYAASATIDGAESATTCGVGISSQGTGDLTVRVTTVTGHALYKIDRWD